MSKISSLIKNVVSISCDLCLKRNIHIYRNVVPWKNTLELSEALIQSVIYKDHGLIVLNKPYGVTFSRSGGRSHEEANLHPEESVFKKESKDNIKNVTGSYKTSGVVNDSLNLVDCLPYLKDHFNIKKLYIARVPERYASGVAILTTSKDLIEHVNKCRLHAPTGKDKYLAVVVGVPRYLNGSIKLGFQLENHPKQGKRVVLLEKWSNNAYKRGEVRIGTFHYKTVSTSYSHLASVLEICVELRKYHAYRVFSADYLLSPVLGDNLFGSRVQTVMGVPMKVNPFSDVANSSQKLPTDLYRMLELTSRQASMIPVHIHLAEMLLPRFYKNKEPLLLKAQPPPHFEWTCEKLGLKEAEQLSIASV